MHSYKDKEVNKNVKIIFNRNDPDLVQAFLKKWWVESDFKAPNLPLSLQLKGSDCIIRVILKRIDDYNYYLNIR
jgi:hypothetical protein